MLDGPSVQARLQQCLGERGPQFATSILSLVNASTQLQSCRAETILSSAMVAATLNLPIQKDLGFAWIVPYGNEAQFQMGYKGFIQLAMRSGQYSRLNVVGVNEKAFLAYDDIGEPLIDWPNLDPSQPAVGYAAAFRLINGFTKAIYWTREQVQAHAERYSQAYRYDMKKGKGSSPWSTDFDAMGKKTVIKELLSKWGILSVELETAIRYDQAASDGKQLGYPDNGGGIDEPEAGAETIDILSKAADPRDAVNEPPEDLGIELDEMAAKES